MSTGSKLFWVAVLYFASGFPNGLLTEFMPAYFRFQGISLKDIGLMSILTLPYTLKFLWAPLADARGSRRSWVIGSQLALLLVLVPIVLVPHEVSPLLWIVLIAFAVVSATQDIAIDAYSIGLLEPREVGPANGIRVTLYRIATIVAGGWLLAMGGEGRWHLPWIAAAVLMVVLPLMSLRLSPIPMVRMRDSSAGGTFRDFWVSSRTALQEFLRRPGFVMVMLFVLTFKLGDNALGAMSKPFWVDQKFSPLEVGLIPGTFGFLCVIPGALLGGYWTGRWGIFRSLWILGLAQAVSNLAYYAAATMVSSAAVMYVTSSVEYFCGGLGTASFLALLMSICNKECAAAQYALLSALFALGKLIAGVSSGYLVELWGYADYFLLTFFLALPAFALLPWVKRWIATAPSAGNVDLTGSTS